MRLKGMIFTIDAVMALALLVAASLTVLVLNHAPFEESKRIDVQQLGFDYLEGGSMSPVSDVGFDFSYSDKSVLANRFVYPQKTECLNHVFSIPERYDFNTNNPACVHIETSWVH